MSDLVVTKEQIQSLIKDEKIRPEDLYPVEQLEQWRHRADVEKRMAEEKVAAAAEKEDPHAKFLDPLRNPFIKLTP